MSGRRAGRSDRSGRIRAPRAYFCPPVGWWESSTIASDTRPAYDESENAFPLADAWLGFACLAALVALRRRSPTALLWLLAAGGGGLYLFGMDVLYDLEHGICGKGAGGAIEALVNLVTLAFSLVALRWAWLHRDELLAGAAHAH